MIIATRRYSLCSDQSQKAVFRSSIHGARGRGPIQSWSSRNYVSNMFSILMPSVFHDIPLTFQSVRRSNQIQKTLSQRNDLICWCNFSAFSKRFKLTEMSWEAYFGGVFILLSDSIVIFASANCLLSYIPLLILLWSPLQNAPSATVQYISLAFSI